MLSGQSAACAGAGVEEQLKRQAECDKLFASVLAYTDIMKRLLHCLSVLLLLCAALPAAPAAAPSIGVSGAYTITLPDSKLPSKPGIVAHVRSLSGQIVGGTLHGIYARLYRQGVPSVILTAPTATVANSGSLVVTATGGVVAKSLTQPGTTLTADKMVWQAGQGTIIAQGHVFYKDSKSGGTMSGPYAVWDIKTQTLNSNGPGRATMKL